MAGQRVTTTKAVRFTALSARRRLPDDQEMLSRIQHSLGAAEFAGQVDNLFSLLGISLP
jgi:hypothetical protein